LHAVSKELEEVIVQLEKSESERQEVNRYAQELLHKVKKDSEALEFMIDRRMIT
jgi:hypothetical protein